MTIFDLNETGFDQYRGKLVKYDNTVMAIARRSAKAEQMNMSKLSWAEHPMSPVNGFSRMNCFTALSIEKSLFIFGQLCLMK